MWSRKKHINAASRRPPSVRRRCREGRIRNTDPLVLSVIHTVEPLKPDLSIDKVQALARGSPEITNDEVKTSRRAADDSVEGPRPELSVGRELKVGLQPTLVRNTSNGGRRNTHTTDGEEQTLQVGERGRGQGQELGGGIEGGASCCLVLLEGISGDQQEGSTFIYDSEMYGGMQGLGHTSVNDSSGGRQDGGTRAVRDGLVDPPVVARG